MAVGKHFPVKETVGLPVYQVQALRVAFVHNEKRNRKQRGNVYAGGCWGETSGYPIGCPLHFIANSQSVLIGQTFSGDQVKSGHMQSKVKALIQAKLNVVAEVSSTRYCSAHY